MALSHGVAADYRDDIGFTALQAELGASTPTGAGVAVSQVEASTVPLTNTAYPVYAPDTAQFSGKTFVFPGAPSTSPSAHATGVGRLFYGSTSVAPGITSIAGYEANDWLNSLYVQSGPNAGAATVLNRRIANHSWVGNGATAADTGVILRLVDRQVDMNEYIQVVGMANGTSNSPLLGSAYNVIAVGRTDGRHDHGADGVANDGVYGANRTRPDLVAPQTTTSAATPVVSAAAAMLVQAGHQGGMALSKGSVSVSQVGTVYNAERSETVKAALIAGADRVTANTTLLSANITDYRSAGHQTANGLDNRFGAGQVNVYNSYHIIAAGERNSAEDGGPIGIGADGFDYDGAFGGGAGSNRTATYTFNADADRMLSASLVWNLKVSNDGALTTSLHNLDLALFDVSVDGSQPVALSASTSDNTENLWIRLFAGHRYEMRVYSPEAANFSSDYAFAWHIGAAPAPVPVPAGVWLLGSGLLGVAGARCRLRRSTP